MRKQTIIVGATVGAAVFLAMAGLNATQSRNLEPQATQGGQGRWQIVNGTPEQARNIMLLDTQTGSSWITCNDSDGSTEWCLIPKTSAGATTKTTP